MRDVAAAGVDASEERTRADAAQAKALVAAERRGAAEQAKREKADLEVQQLKQLVLNLHTRTEQQLSLIHI